MDRICNFNEWLSLKESSSARPAAKSGLYPLGYGGIGQYPPAWWLPAAADAIFYVTQDHRLFDNGVSSPWSIEHIPGPTDISNPNQGEGGLFDIRHLPGKSSPPKDSPLPDDSVRPTSWVKLVQKTTVISPKASYLPD